MLRAQQALGRECLSAAHTGSQSGHHALSSRMPPSLVPGAGWSCTLPSSSEAMTDPPWAINVIDRAVVAPPEAFGFGRS